MFAIPSTPLASRVASLAELKQIEEELEGLKVSRTACATAEDYDGAKAAQEKIKELEEKLAAMPLASWKGIAGNGSSCHYRHTSQQRNSMVPLQLELPRRVATGAYAVHFACWLAEISAY
jgi:ATP-dependent Clp protease ATP-binding subunit ClpA